jgi:zinc protease
MNLLNLEYEKYFLQNGLEVIIYNNVNLPIVAVNLWYRVGSSYEKKGKTGLAHLFEHMMFQGSQNVPKEMHFRFIQEAGGNLNGSTSFDRTNYYEKVPSNFLELIFWLESDRMGFLLPSLTQEKLANQIDVVKNERLERYDNQPYGLAWETLLSKLYTDGHQYGWPTIGYLDDISSYTMEDVISFFKNYYSPSNATMVVAGHFDNDSAKDHIARYFGEIKGHGNFIDPVITPKETVPLKENILVVKEENIQLERIYLAWKTEPAYSRYDATLDIMADLFTGSKNSRLYKALVHDNQLAQDVSAFQFSGKLAGHFVIVATAKPGVTLDKIKDIILSEKDKIIKDKVSDRELLRSKNGIKSSFIYSLQNIESLADQLNHYNFYLNEPNSFSRDLSRYEDVDEEFICNAAEKYLNGNYVELRIQPPGKL